MIEFGDVTYWIDFERVSELCCEYKTNKPKHTEIRTTTYVDGTISKEETTNSNNFEINPLKYETIKLMLEVLMSNDDELDTSLGSASCLEKTSFSFQMAFNTLLKHNILKEE